MAISLHYRSFEEGLVEMDSIWTRYVYVLEESKFLIFWRKVEGPLRKGGPLAAEIANWSQKKLLTFLKQFRVFL